MNVLEDPTSDRDQPYALPTIPKCTHGEFVRAPTS